MLSFKSYISESRRNPELNPKVSAYDELKEYAKLDDYYISFTAIDKLGINPHSEYDSPLGIFAYPLKETWKEYNVEKHHDFREYPFANELPFIWLFSAKDKSKVLNLAKYTQSQYKKDIKKLQALPNNVIDWDTVIQKVESTALKDTVYGYIWNLLRWAGNEYRNPDKPYLNLNLNWSNMFRKIGYEGVSDKYGTGTIHENEPIQAVFFSKDYINIIKKVNNIAKVNSRDTDIIIDTIDDIKKISLKLILKTDTLWAADIKDKPVSINYPSDDRIIFRFPFNKKFYLFLKNNISWIEKEIDSFESINWLRDEDSVALRMFIGNIVGNVDLKKYPNTYKFICKLVDKFPSYKKYFNNSETYMNFFDTYSNVDNDFIEYNLNYIHEQDS